MNRTQFTDLILREFLENNIIEKDGYLKWREERGEKIKELAEQFEAEILLTIAEQEIKKEEEREEP